MQPNAQGRQHDCADCGSPLAWMAAMLTVRPIRRSLAARLSLPAGLFAAPVLVVAALAHHAGLISTTELYPLIAFGFLLGAWAVGGAIYAAVTLWERGGTGWGQAFWSFVYGAIALIPAGFALAGVVAYPRLADVSTDTDNPPPILGQPGAATAEDTAHWQLQREAFPDLVSRRFRVTPAELGEAAIRVIERSGWRLIGATPAGLPEDPVQLQAEARTLLFGFRDDVVVRILPDPFGARLDLRSASRSGVHDLGTNARRLRRFLQDLDAALLEAYGVLEPVVEGEPPPEPEELPLLSDAPLATGDRPTPLPPTKPSGSEGAPSGLLPLLPEDTLEIYQDEQPQ